MAIRAVKFLLLLASKTYRKSGARDHKYRSHKPDFDYLAVCEVGPVIRKNCGAFFLLFLKES